MARVITLAFKVPSPADALKPNDVVTTLPGVYWRVAVHKVVGDEVFVQLWPLNGHDVTLRERVQEVPVKMAREVLDARMGPRVEAPA